MNLFGKILVALNLVMSLVFMGFAVAVYSTHQNWREVAQREKKDAAPPTKPVGLVYQVEDLLLKNDELVKKIEALRAEISQEKRLKDSRLALLETEKDKLDKEVVQKSMDIQTITQDKQTTSANIEKLTLEVGKKSAEIEALSKEVSDEKFKTEELHKTILDLTDKLSKANTSLAKLQTQLKGMFAGQGPGAGPTTDKTPKLDGVVRAANAEFVEISLGSDDGVARGQTMIVYRPGSTANATKLLGKIEILQTTADVSVGKVLPEYRKGNIEKDDRVATRLN